MRKYVRTVVSEPAILVTGNKENRQVYAVTIIDRSYMGRRVRMPSPIAPETEVVIRFSTGKFDEAVVVYCRQVAHGEYHVGVKLTRVTDRRKEPRFPISEPAQLRVVGPEEDPRPMEVQATDVSKSGIGIIAPLSISPGTSIEIRLASAVLSGVVCYSVPATDGFRMGVSLTQVIGRNALSATLPELIHHTNSASENV